MPFYTLSASAGMIRSNRFAEKAEAICIGSFRAEHLALPVKIYEHVEAAEKVCVLICNPDGSVQAPVGAGNHSGEYDQMSHDLGARNADQAYVLLSNYDEQAITTFYLKSNVTETLASQLEKELGVEIGLYDPQTLHAYTEDAAKVRAIETKLAEASVEIERVRDQSMQKHKIAAATELVEAARKAHKMARASRMPEMSLRATSKFGGGLKVNCHCEMVPGSGDSSPKLRVYADGSPIGEVKDERQAARLISEYAERAFSKFLKKEMA